MHSVAGITSRLARSLCGGLSPPAMKAVRRAENSAHLPARGDCPSERRGMHSGRQSVLASTDLSKPPVTVHRRNAWRIFLSPRKLKGRQHTSRAPNTKRLPGTAYPHHRAPKAYIPRPAYQTFTLITRMREYPACKLAPLSVKSDANLRAGLLPSRLIFAWWWPGMRSVVCSGALVMRRHAPAYAEGCGLTGPTCIVTRAWLV